MRDTIRALLIALLAGSAFCQNANESPAFESTDVHVSPPSRNPTMRDGVIHGERYEVHTATMVDLIATAYGIVPDKILGGTNWLDWDRFDVVAKAPLSTTRADLNLMLQRMLADRFKLVVHRDTKPMPAFVLTVGKGNHKMKASVGSADSGCRSVPQNPAPGTVPYQVIACQNMTMSNFADVLTNLGGLYLPDAVVDQTGLTQAWDFELKWTQRNRIAQAGSDGITLFDALDRQLGLKLEAQKAPQPVLIVETVNRVPTPNDPELMTKIPPPPPTQFEVATVKLTPPEVRQTSGGIQPGRLDLQNYPLRRMIQLAWDLNDNPEMLVGLPPSADSVYYDVVAKVASSGAVKAQDVDFDTLRLMLRGLLAERFGLKTHIEDRPVNAYTLTAAPQTKLQKADPQNRTSCKAAGAARNPMLKELICTNVSMTQFALILENYATGYIKAPIKDATGIDGYWDVTVAFSGVNLLPGGIFDPNANSGTADPNGSVTLPEALQKQLGLKLQMGKRSIPVLVVDHVESKPTEN